MNRIKEVLKDKGIKQVWLAERLGKSYNMVNGYVTNKRQPSIVILYEIAELLNVGIKDLLIDKNESDAKLS
jgi:repressor LexA